MVYKTFQIRMILRTINKIIHRISKICCIKVNINLLITKMIINKIIIKKQHNSRALPQILTSKIKNYPKK